MYKSWMVWFGESGVNDLYINEVARAVENIPAEQGQMGHMTDGYADSAIRRSEVRWLTKNEYPVLVDFAWQFAVSANKGSFGVDITDLPQLQHTTYKGEDEGYYSWHHDVFWTAPEPFDRKLSIVIQLTDGNDYEGGDLEFEGGIEPPDPQMLRQKGTVIVFPSVFQHRVTPVTKGVRNSLVGWVEGPPWR